MASDTTEDPEVEDAETAEAAPKPRGSLLSNKKVKILALLALVMGVEAAGFYLLVPTSAGPEIENKEEVVDDSQTVEVTVMANEHMTNNNTGSGTATDVTFTIVAVVPSSQSAEFDLAVKKDRAGLIKSEVRTIIQGSSMEELKEPAGAIVSQRIKEAINKALRKSYVSRILLVKWNVTDR